MCQHYHPQSCDTPAERLYAGGGFTRRRFLSHGLGLLSAAATVPAFLMRAGDALAADTTMRLSSVPGTPDGRVLVIVQLSGGNDGLNTVVPIGDDAYAEARPGLAHPTNEVLALPGVDGIGLHPALGPIQELVQAGLCGVVQGVGYPNPNRSHFASMDIWHTADLSGQGGRGWIGQSLETRAPAGGAESAAGMDCLSIGSAAPLATLGKSQRPVSFAQAELFRFAARGQDAEVADTYDTVNHHDVPADDEDPLAFIQRTALDAQVASERVRKAVAGDSKTDWPNHGLARQLKMVARMVRADLPTRVYYVTMGGFDTHSGQKGNHQRLMTQFGSAMKAFYDELDATGDRSRVVSLAFSEFGRRVRQNASAGTDHGCAGPSFVFGDAVTPGLIGTHPSLTDLDDGDLKFGIDFRSVYTDLLEGWLKLDAKAALGRKYPTAGVLRAV